MIVIFIERLLQILGLIALQVLVCNHIYLWGLATPMLYPLFLVYLPLNSNRIGNMLWAFVLGVAIDTFSNTPGEAAAAMTFTAFIQWPLLHAMAPKDCVESMVPTYHTMGRWTHIRYVTILTTIHHIVFYLLESFSFFHAQDTLIAFGASLMLSLVLMLTLETLRHGK